MHLPFDDVLAVGISPAAKVSANEGVLAIAGCPKCSAASIRTVGHFHAVVGDAILQVELSFLRS
jgi:hypothetical protein